MTSITLFYSPVTCAKVPLICLEEIGVPFELRLMRLRKGEHKAPDFRRYNGTGKVPAILIDGRALSENVAIVGLLDTLFPDAALLPPAPDAMTAARRIADLCFCAATLHPFVSRICVPMTIAPPQHRTAVQRQACEGIREHLQIVEDRLAAGPWWYGTGWSAMDAYLYWVIRRLGTVGYPLADFPRYLELAERMDGRPATRRATMREAQAMATLEAEGMDMKIQPLSF